jgi:glycosyltransferase involved in cell wall biosynthesis
VRILILHSRYRSGAASGENRVVEDEARLLSEGGHDVEVFAPSVRDPSGMELIRTGARVVWSGQAAAAVRKRLGQFQPDIVHCHNLFPALSPSVLREASERAPVVMTLHNYRLMCLPGIFLRDGRICEDCLGRTPWPGVVHGCYQDSVPASFALGASLRLHRHLGTFDRVGLYLAISQFVRTKHLEGGLAPERVVVKPHFAWPGELRQTPGEYFLYLGRLSQEKGVATLLEAWHGIRAKLLVVGDGPDTTRLRSMAPSNVDFMPTVIPDKARILIRSARAVLVPSLSFEGAGKVVMEAYAAGVPAVVSRAGGLPEFVQDGVTGLLIPPGDVKAWAEAIERLFDDSECDRMGRASLRLWADEYSPERGLTQLEDVYRFAIATGSSRHGS